MKESAFAGPNVPLITESFGLYLFNKLNSHEPSKVILVSSDTNEEYTAYQIQTKAIQLAFALKKHVKRGDVIASLCENDNLAVFPFLASLYLGSTIAFVNPIYNTRELLESLSNVNPKFIFCSAIALNKITDIQHELGDLQEIVLTERVSSDGFRTIDDFISSCNDTIDIDHFKPTDSNNNDDTALILSSSGTTGIPKGVKITYGNLISQLPYDSYDGFINIKYNDVIVLLAPIFHVFGLLFLLFTHVSGCRGVFIKRFKPELFLECLEKHKVTKLTVVPPLAIFLAKNPSVDKYDLSNLNDIICGAAPVSQVIVDSLYKRLNVRVRQLYGLTETGGITCTPPNFPININSAGRVGPNFEVVIKDLDTRNVVPINQKGEICVRGPNVTKGYYRNEEATKNAFDSAGYFLTGDIGYFDEDGNLFIVDRIKELIKYKGFQVAPAELEGILLKHESVKDVAVVGMPDENAGELPTAFVVRRPNYKVSADSLAKFVAAQVSTYKQLSGGVKFIDEIPKNPGGKILRRQLKDKLLESEEYH